MPFEDNLGYRTPPADGSEGTASIKLTLKGKKEPLKLNGCFIPNDENLKKLINDQTYLGKHEETKFFIYFCCMDKNLENNVVKTEINAHRFTKPNRDKQCTIDHGPESAFFLYKECHVFLPACHIDLKTTEFEKFLEKYSKKIPSQFHQVTANGQYKGLTQNDGLVKFLPVKLTSSNGCQVLEDSSFIRVVNGPFLDSNEVVGYCCKESDGSRINVYMLGTQDVTVVPSGITGPSPGSLNLSSQDVELYSIKLKEAITKQTDLLPRGIAQSTLKTDDIFTNLTVYQGKQKSLQEKTQEDNRTRKTVTKITELFVDENEDNPKTILVSGEPGIGKTMFSHKIVRDWSTNCISIPKIKFTYLITFRQLVMLGNKELTLRELLNRSPFLNTSTMMDDTVMAHAIHHSEQFFVVLDGFDEYKDHNKILGRYESQFPNDAETKMPVAALISKLIHKKILCDSIVMITSRPGEASKLDEKLHFDRCVEITGFSQEQVLQYVEKYFNSKSEEVKKMAMKKVKGTAHYMSFGRVPLRCLFVCQVIEWEIKNKITRNNLVPLTLTQFYREIISCLERANREMDSLDKEEASLAVEKTLHNFSELAAQLAEQNRFAFSQKDLEKLKLPENEISYLKSSSLVFCYPIASDSPFPQTTLEYSFSHLTIQEFFVACHLVKKRAMAAQGTSDMVHIFTSGLFGLDQENNNDKRMSKVLESVWKQGENGWIQRVVLLRCLHEYGQEKEFTRQELTTNRDYRYWDSAGWIALDGVTDTACDALAMLLESTATSISSLPDTLYIVNSQITITMLTRLLSSLHSNSTITMLWLWSCSLNDDHVKCLCNHLINTHITSLTLAYNNITDVGVHHIVHSNIASKLTYLDLQGNPVSVEVSKSSKQFCQDNYPRLRLEI